MSSGQPRPRSTFTPDRMPHCVGVTLPVEVVDEAGQAPALLIGTQLPRVVAHRGLDRKAVLPQAGILDPLVQQRERLLAGRECGVAHGAVLTKKAAQADSGLSAPREERAHLSSKNARFFSM